MAYFVESKPNEVQEEQQIPFQINHWRFIRTNKTKQNKTKQNKTKQTI